MRKALWLSLLLAIAQPSYAGVSITDIKFYNRLTVHGRRLPERPIAGAINRNNLGRLYARFTIIGTQDTIEQLAKSGYLSVTAEWSLNGKVIDSIEVGISQQWWDDSESELRRQVEENGFFAFRTATYRTFIPVGIYKLTIRDSQRNILSPQAFPGPGVYQPTIEVKRP